MKFKIMLIQHAGANAGLFIEDFNEINEFFEDFNEINEFSK